MTILFVLNQFINMYLYELSKKQRPGNIRQLYLPTYFHNLVHGEGNHCESPERFTKNWENATASYLPEKVLHEKIEKVNFLFGSKHL